MIIVLERLVILVCVTASRVQRRFGPPRDTGVASYGVRIINMCDKRRAALSLNLVNGFTGHFLGHAGFMALEPTQPPCLLWTWPPRTGLTMTRWWSLSEPHAPVPSILILAGLVAGSSLLVGVPACDSVELLGHRNSGVLPRSSAS